MQPFIHWSLLAVAVATPALSTPLSTSYSSNHYSDRTTLTPAPLHVHQAEKVIEGSYIVMLKKDSPPAVMGNHLNYLQQAHKAIPSVDQPARIKHVYDSDYLRGYAASFHPDALDELRSKPEVDFIEHDSIVHTMNTTTEKGAPWGLARISHRKKLGFATFTRYEYEEYGGEGVDVYVVDTGINVDHVEFEGRATWGKTIPEGAMDADGNGHGTHCAGTIASKKYGVAKKAKVHAVKVLGDNGSGSMSDVVAGVVWAAEAAKAKRDAAAQEYAATGKTSHKGSVANMSLGGGKSPALDRAVNGAVDTGLHFAVAAGNDNRDACNYSPAAAEKAVTVGASTLGDDRAYFSNHGKCVDVFAPGLNILSTWNTGPTSTNTISGTSMASPHVAGLLAYFLSLYPHETFTPYAQDALVEPVTLQQVFSAPTSLYTFIHRSLPHYIRDYLPSPRIVSAIAGEDVAAYKTITPALLKQAVIDLGTSGILKDLPPSTVNILVFNNATA